MYFFFDAFFFSFESKIRLMAFLFVKSFLTVHTFRQKKNFNVNPAKKLWPNLSSVKYSKFLALFFLEELRSFMNIDNGIPSQQGLWTFPKKKQTKFNLKTWNHLKRVGFFTAQYSGVRFLFGSFCTFSERKERFIFFIQKEKTTTYSNNLATIF